MKVTTKLTIEIEGTDIQNLRTGLQKIVEEQNKVGLKNSEVTVDEMRLLQIKNQNLRLL